LDTMYDIPDMDDVEEVVINAEVVKEGQKPLLVRSDKKKPKKSAKEDEKEVGTA
jgi:ATP-dependent Clp protease ATP-binding subunit ClpX